MVTAAIYAVVMALAKGERARAFKAVSPGMLPPLGILFSLFVAFTAAQVWGDNDRAGTAVDREATALSSVLFMASNFPGAREAQIRALIHDYIEQVTSQEWPEMAQRAAHLRITPQPLADALKAIFALAPSTPGQVTAQHEMIIAVDSALDARRQRIIVSQSQVNLVKWSCLLVQAICMLIAVAMVHSDNRRTAAIAMALYAAGVAVSVLLILAHERPFTGNVAIGTGPLRHVMPEIEAGQ
jgi:hypothetical protein